MNLLEETCGVLRNYNRDINEVWYVTDCIYATTWEEFADEAKDINYDCSYGANEINIDLMIVGRDWWLERQEYDGSEWWEYREVPRVRPLSGKLNITTGDYSDD